MRAVMTARSYRYGMCKMAPSTLARPQEQACSASVLSPLAVRSSRTHNSTQLMKTPRFILIRAASATLVAIAIAAPATIGAQQIVTNWAAYHEHRPGPTIPPHVPTAASWGTRTNVTTFDMGPGNTSGNLINFYTG